MLPSEWHPQAFVQLTWPHEGTDWAPMMDEVISCYRCMAREISLCVPLVVVAQNTDDVLAQLQEIRTHAPHPIQIIYSPTNDTWARDHAFITIIKDGHRTLLDYQFNGWGMKFAANLDNQINKSIFPILNKQLKDVQYCSHLDFVLEGGSIESDGMGTLLTTTSCLLASNRNDLLSQEQIEERLLSDFDAQRVLWLHHGHLIGDDTDGHIDTLARLCPNDTIVYVKCSDPSDEHYEDLSQMERELKSFRTLNGRPYRLVPLPMVHPIFEEGERLPATYANFLILRPSTSDKQGENGTILYPTYGQPSNDHLAHRQLQIAFPEYKLVGVDCRALIKQHGSLHCCTMQYPSL